MRPADHAAALGDLGVFQGTVDGMVFTVGTVMGWPLMLLLLAEPLRNLGRTTPADAYAVAIAVVVSLMFIAVLLAATMLAVGATVVARGVNYGTAFEIALKIRELSGLFVEAYSPADLMHGPIAAVRPGWPVIAVAPTGPAHDTVAALVPELAARDARLIAVSDVPELLARADTPLPLVPGVPEWLSPLVAVVPGQVTAMRLAQLRGLDIDNTAGLRKVTLTR